MSLLGMLGMRNTFHADPAKLDTSNYGGTIDQAGQGALDRSQFDENMRRQTELYGQYGDVAAGRGPNPAMAMLRNQTAQNMLGAQGQVASQRGINPSMAARAALDAGTAANQNAAGQGALMQAQQSLGALGQQAGLAGQMQQGALGQQGLMGQMYGAAAGAQNAQNNSNIANTLGTNQINAGVAAQNTQMGGQLIGGLLNGAGAMGASYLGGLGSGGGGGGGGYAGDAATGGDFYMQHAGRPYAEGGQVQPPDWLTSYLDQAAGMAQGGQVQPKWQPGQPPPALPAHLDNWRPPERPLPEITPPWYEGETAKLKPKTKGYDVKVQKKAVGGEIDGVVPGEPRHPGVNTGANDTVPALLTPKEIVLPLSITQASDAPERAKLFVEHLLRSQGTSGYEDVIRTRGMAEGGEVEEKGPEKDPEKQPWYKRVMQAAEYNDEPGEGPGQAEQARRNAKAKKAALDAADEGLSGR